MTHDVVSTKRAGDILGCDRTAVVKMIHDGTIKSAYMGSADGYVGRPGYKISVDELYELKTELENKKLNGKRTRKNNKKNEPVKTRDTFAIKSALGELQICLGMLSETIEKLKEEL